MDSEVDNKLHQIHNKSSVKFPEDVHEPDIIVEKETDSSISVNLGFLQKDHRYEISFTIEDDVRGEVKMSPEEHFWIKVIGAYPTQNENGHDVILELIARKDGVMSEEFNLVNTTDENQSVKVVLHARVLGRHKGTPLLKEGIHCIGMEAPEDESEASDWAGFD
ncbi:adipose-secreted signaling protein-like isoform X2 [Ptychodera flava]|uniref:adipose-secreted signaling protein-like isoform X2 n=1 Tax=Ptychodera flava TaxID=63121 RepID=UPI00396A2552